MAAATASISDEEMMTFLPSLANSPEGDIDSHSSDSMGDPFADDGVLDEYLLDSDSDDPSSPLNFLLQKKKKEPQKKKQTRQQRKQKQNNCTTTLVKTSQDVFQRKKGMPPPPPVFLTTTSTKSRESTTTAIRKRPRSSQETEHMTSATSRTGSSTSDDFVERKKRKNLREQERSRRITEQIEELRRVLSDTAGIIFYKTDKQSILSTVVDYIRERQSNLVLLDAEHQKLMAMQNQTSKFSSPSTNYITSSTKSLQSDADPLGPTMTKEILEPSSSMETATAFQQPATAIDTMTSFDYKSIFSQCPAALAIVALNGRFLDCNDEFENLSGYSRKELTDHHMSLFHFLHKKALVADVWNVMCTLVQDEEKQQTGKSSCFWNGVIESVRRPDCNLVMTITISRSTIDGRPLLFNCTLSG